LSGEVFETVKEGNQDREQFVIALTGPADSLVHDDRDATPARKKQVDVRVYPSVAGIEAQLVVDGIVVDELDGSVPKHKYLVRRRVSILNFHYGSRDGRIDWCDSP
jgi:hypothetical protein